MEVLILGVYLEIFLFRIKWSKIRVRIIHGRALYTGKYGTAEQHAAIDNAHWAGVDLDALIKQGVA